MTLVWERIELFALFFARAAGFIYLMPVTGNRMVPIVAKTGLSVFVSIILLLSTKMTTIPVPRETMSFVFNVSVEVFIGLTLGFVTLFLFSGIQVAGEIVGMQMGLAMAKMVDPGFQAQLSIVAQFQMFMALLFYLVIDGHHFLLRGFAYSYEVIPIFSNIQITGVVELILRMAVHIFVVAVKIGSPVVVALLLANIALGILARTVPQMNIFMVGLPLRLLLGIISLAFTVRMFHQIFRFLWGRFQEDFMLLIHAF